MLQYIGDDSYLQLHMNLLRDESKTIQVEAGFSGSISSGGSGGSGAVLKTGSRIMEEITR